MGTDSDLNRDVSHDVNHDVNYGGVIDALVSGEWEEPGTGRRYEIPPEDIVIAASLEGREAELVRRRHPGRSLIIVSDPCTYEALGARVFQALKADGADVTEHVWEQPVCSDRGVEALRAATRGREALVAVGSGTINDAVKYASFLDGRDYSVFATSPMNAYTTNTASVSFDGFKRSITCHGARGIFFDLAVIARCPERLISAAFADVICRTTAQLDWLLSHRLFGTPYAETPYHLLAIDEDRMIDNASHMRDGDVEVLGMLTRISAIMGLGTSFTETTHSGSMAEHMISHHIDMFSGEEHPGTSHGEQVGVATVTMSRLHNRILNAAGAPTVHATRIPEARLRQRYGADMADNMIEQTRIKALDEAGAERVNRLMNDDWEAFRRPLRAIMLPFDRLHDAMRAAGCQTTPEQLGLSASRWHEAVTDARYIRDRFSMLDIADDAGLLSGFLTEHCPPS